MTADDPSTPGPDPDSGSPDPDPGASLDDASLDDAILDGGPLDKASLDDGSLDEAPGSGLEPGSDRSPLPFEGLTAPAPLTAAPPTTARWLAFTSILVGGLLGGLIGYGTADVMAGGGMWAPLGGIVGAAIGAVGVGIVAGLALRAMNEWRAVQHPEASP